MGVVCEIFCYWPALQLELLALINTRQSRPQRVMPRKAMRRPRASRDGSLAGWWMVDGG